MKYGEIVSIIDNKHPLERWDYCSLEEKEWGVKYTFRDCGIIRLNINNNVGKYNYLVIGINSRNNSFSFANHDFDIEENNASSINFNKIESLSIEVEKRR